MIRTLLIDDERAVIEGLKKLIKWEELGFELVGTAINGIEGKQKAEKLRPELIIADIRMPGLDGLSMIEVIQKELKETTFVIMSGYADFAYAKKALKLGVIDYLEKPVTIQKVTEMLERVKTIEDKNRKEKENEARSHSLGEVTLGKTLLEYIYSENQMQTFEGMEKLKEYHGWCIFKAVFCSYEKDQDNIFESSLRRLSNSSEKELIVIKRGEQFTGVLVSERPDEPKAKWYAVFEKVYKEISHHLKNMYLGVGEVYSKPSYLRQSYMEAKSALSYAKFSQMQQVIFYEQLIKNVPVVGLGEFDENVLIRNLRAGAEEEANKQIKAYLDSLKKNGLDFRIFEQECLRLVYMGNGVMLEKNKNFRLLSSQNILPHEMLQMCTDYKQAEDWVHSLFKEYFEVIEQFKEDEGHSAFNRAKDYIFQNYTRDISLNEVAEKAGMNPAYFSQLFKEKMGISYVKYLTNLRLDYAQKLLDQGYKVVQVSEKVGYVNYRYFCDTFKKNLGITPNQYKQNKMKG